MARIAMNVALFLLGWKENLRLPKIAPQIRGRIYLVEYLFISRPASQMDQVLQNVALLILESV
uniref:Uncharacterized protein n=1 Tax=Candidatus Kentrum sp. LPFa TaxID=2126335 RepID=A0A450X978_9GAMM|nr:MAG: hypothetical protein BECKLPF1236B_GA0070989_15212 [Candidatus Kentron sp. LPFa]